MTKKEQSENQLSWVRYCKVAYPKLARLMIWVLCLLFTASSSLIVSSCSHTRRITIDNNTEQTEFDKLTQSLQNRAVKITLSDGQYHYASKTKITQDSTSWRSVKSNDSWSVATSSIREITHKSRSKGAVDGLLIGSAIGFSAGVLIIENPDGSTDFKVGDRVQAGFSGALGGVLWGAVIGAIMGAKVKYQFYPSQD